MPFRSRSRFSATPRRSWRRRRSPVVGTRGPRLQQAQFNLNFDFFVAAQPTNGPPQESPRFNIQAMSPWSNLSESGYDRSLMLRGIVFDFNMYVLSFDSGTGEQPGLTSSARAFMPVQSWWFVDGFDPQSEAPTSYLTSPYGPFVNNPPIISPGDYDVSDSGVLPLRILKRKMGRLKVGNEGSVGVQTGGDNDAGGLTRFSWSSVIRKRISIDDKQGLYWAIHALSPFASIDVFLSCWLNGIYYYTLRR